MASFDLATLYIHSLTSYLESGAQHLVSMLPASSQALVTSAGGELSHLVEVTSSYASSLNIGPGKAVVILAVGFPVFTTTRYLVRFLFGFIHYRRQAMGTGLPMVYVPYLETNNFFANLVRTETYKRFVYGVLPSSWTRWKRWVRPEFRWLAKYDIHVEKSDIFQVVTPEQVVVNIADADVIMDILTRKGDFPKYQSVLAPVKLFGENVVTTEGQEWSRHRKVVGPTFNEGTFQFVWNESIRQATKMLNYWTSTPPSQHHDISVTLKMAALNVISSVAFGIPLPFNHDVDVTTLDSDTLLEHKLGNAEKGVATRSSESPTGHRMTFRKAMSIVTGDFRKVVATMMIPRWSLSLMGERMKEVNQAKLEVDTYVRDMIRREQLNPTVSENGKDTLMSTLVKHENRERGMNTKSGLSPQELLGNAYIFVVAGLDTTSSALNFILLNLAIHQDKQAWFHRQLDHDLKAAGVTKDPMTWNYKDVISQLTGPMCVVYEGLRTHPTTPTILRTTGDKSQTLTMDNKTYVIPPEFTLALNFIGLHYNPKYWGGDAAQFCPERWSVAESTGRQKGSYPSTRFPGVLRPARGTFLPWSEGFRACLGRRFAEVEMAVMLAVLFSGHRCQVARLPGESEAAAKQRAQGALDRATMQISLGVREKVDLLWTPR